MVPMLKWFGLLSYNPEIRDIFTHAPLYSVLIFSAEMLILHVCKRDNYCGQFRHWRGKAFVLLHHVSFCIYTSVQDTACLLLLYQY